ncbi:hypothetical protein [Kitasatospora sp. NPDC056531]|uniref:hypothetical protein n=1 Tax=Kitasatospora sp. NPDC056531 TaxID=3345856 RepID=UPI0036AAB931
MSDLPTNERTTARTDDHTHEPTHEPADGSAAAPEALAHEARTSQLTATVGSTTIARV